MANIAGLGISNFSVAQGPASDNLRIEKPIAQFSIDKLAKSAPADAQKAAQAFETQFLTQFLQTIFDLVPDAEGFDGGAGEKAFKPFLVEEYAKALSSRGGVGIAQSVLAEILRYQTPGTTEQAQSVTPPAIIP